MPLHRLIGSLVVLGVCLLWFSPQNRAHCQEQDAKNTDAMQQFAQRFLVACFSDTDDPSIKDMVAYPFIFIAPCKGGTAESFDEFSGLVLTRTQGRRLPQVYDKRQVVTVERYINSFPEEMFATNKDREALIKGIGKDVRVTYFVQGKERDGVAIAIMVRTMNTGFRAVGLGGVEWAEANR